MWSYKPLLPSHFSLIYTDKVLTCTFGYEFLCSSVHARPCLCVSSLKFNHSARISSAGCLFFYLSTSDRFWLLLLLPWILQTSEETNNTAGYSYRRCFIYHWGIDLLPPSPTRTSSCFSQCGKSHHLIWSACQWLAFHPARIRRCVLLATLSRNQWSKRAVDVADVWF